MLAIWMTGSIFASGKWPLRPAHSMSNDSTRSGASLDHSPSGRWLTTSLHRTCASTWQYDAGLPCPHN
eukprot:278602-Chlamydomonas_euryale.AAC.1